MLYNKNQFKKLNDKKVLHKIKKHWVTVSVALLGLLGVKSIATHTNVNADVSADSAQANHQLSSQSIKSTASLVPNKAVGVTSTSVQPSSSAMHSASTSSVATNSSSASALQPKSTASSSAANVSGSVNVASAAQHIHDHVLGEYANNNVSQVRRTVGASVPTETPEATVNNGLIDQLVNIVDNNVQSGADKVNASNAYSNLMNIISPSNLATVADNNTSASTWYGYLTSFQNDLTTINNNGSANPVVSKILDKLNDLENQSIHGYTLKSNASSALNIVPSYNLNNLAIRFDTPGGFAHSLLKQVIPDENKLDQIGTVMRIMNDAANDPTLKSNYSDIASDLTKLPSQTKAKQADTLSDLSNHISTFARNISSQGLPVQDNECFNDIKSGLKSTSKSVSNESTQLKNEVINNELNQYHVGSLFNDVINYVTTNSDYAKLDSVASGAKTDFANAANASDFINSFVNQIADLKNADASTIHNDLNRVKDNSAVSDAYNLTKANSSAANNVLDDLAGLNSANAINNLNNVHNAISGDASLAAINALSNVAASASNEATSLVNASNASVSASTTASNAYKAFLNSSEAPLFSAVINRINASGFNSAAFNTLVDNTENDLKQAPNASAFVNSLANQDSNFNGITAKSIKNDLTSFANSPEFSNAYQAVRASSAAADGILNNLSGMNSDNEVAKLSDIANVLGANFSDTNVFGSLATDASLMVNSVANSQAESAYQEAKDYASSASLMANKIKQYAELSNNKASELTKTAQKANSEAQNALSKAKQMISANTDEIKKNIKNINAILSKVKKDLANADQSAKDILKTPNVSGVASMIPFIFKAIIKPGFDTTDFSGAISEVENHLSNATDLNTLWNNIKGTPSVQAFTGHHGSMTDKVISVLNNNGGLNGAYQQLRTDSKFSKILNDLVTIADNHEDANGKSASQNNNTTISNSLDDITKIINNDPKISGINGMSNIVSKVNSVSLPSVESTPKSTVTPNVSSVVKLIPKVLARMTAANFDNHDFDNVIAAVKKDINSASSLSKLWSDIDSTASVKHFVGPVANTITSILNDGNSKTMKALNVAYRQVHTNNNVINILNDLQKIADNHLDADDIKDQNGKRDAIRATLANIERQLNNSALKSINGVNQIANKVQSGINDKLYKDQPDSSNKVIEPHYVAGKFNDLLGHVINGYTLNDLVNHLTSNNFAKSGERPAFNDILNELQDLPNKLTSQKAANKVLNHISSDLGKFNGPRSHVAAAKLQKLIQNIEANDKTPDALAAYADGLKNADGNLINDLNKGMQDVKSGQNNTNYKRVLSDLIDLDTNPANKDHDLAKIAYTIKHGDLRKISLLENVAQTLHQIAKRDNDQQRKNKAHQKPAKKPSNSAAARREQAAAAAKSAHQQHMANRKAAEQTSERDKSDHAKADVAHQQHMKARSAVNDQYRRDVARRKAINKVNQDADVIKSYEDQAVTEAYNALQSANSAQNETFGFNPGHDSDEARINANRASGDANFADTFAVRAITDYYLARNDGDNVSAANADLDNALIAAENASGEANDVTGDVIAASEDASQAGSVSNSASQPSNGNSGASNSSSASQPSSSASQSGNSNSSSMSSNNPTSFTPSTSGSVVTPNSASHSNSNTPIIIINGSQSSSTAPYTPMASAVPQNSGLVTFASTASSTPASISQSRTSNGYALFNKINNDNSMVTADLVSAMKDFKNPAIKRDPKITSRVQSDEKMLSQIQNQVDRDLSHPSQRAVVNANDCAVRAGLVANDAKMLLASAEGYNGNHVDNQNDDFNRYGHGVTKGTSSEPNPGYESTGRQNGTVQDAMDDNAEGVESSSSSNNESANDQNGSDKLPQTGEVQNNAAFVIMGLIALSVALTSALGADLTKKRRHE